MYELIRISAHDYYIDCPAKIGLVEIGGGQVVLIDSGSDKDAGKKVLRHLEAHGWQLAAIFNTHSHADHIGGNRFLQDRTGCRIYAPGLEAAFTNVPLLEPMTLYGGYPPRALRHKFLLAQESAALPLTAEALPTEMELLPLPGHSFDMVGFRTADGNIFLGDCVSSRDTLEKYGIGYLWDVEASLVTLEKVAALEAPCFIPAHAPVSAEIAELARYNAEAIHAVADRLLDFCRAPIGLDALLQKVFEAYGLTMTAQQHALIGSTVRSYLAWLCDSGRLAPSLDENILRWHRQEA